MSTHRIVIERDLCSGFGACADIDPDELRPRPRRGGGRPRGGHRPEAALAAARACPMGAIRVTDERRPDGGLSVRRRGRADRRARAWRGPGAPRRCARSATTGPSSWPATSRISHTSARRSRRACCWAPAPPHRSPSGGRLSGATRRSRSPGARRRPTSTSMGAARPDRRRGAMRWRRLVIATGARARRLPGLPEPRGGAPPAHPRRRPGSARRICSPGARLDGDRRGLRGRRGRLHAPGSSTWRSRSSRRARCPSRASSARRSERGWRPACASTGVDLRLGARLRAAGGARRAGVAASSSPTASVSPATSCWSASAPFRTPTWRPSGSLARAEDGGFATDACGRTGHPGVFACGDVASAWRGRARAARASRALDGRRRRARARSPRHRRRRAPRRLRVLLLVRPVRLAAPDGGGVRGPPARRGVRRGRRRLPRPLPRPPRGSCAAGSP